MSDSDDGSAEGSEDNSDAEFKYESESESDSDPKPRPRPKPVPERRGGTKRKREVRDDDEGEGEDGDEGEEKVEAGSTEPPAKRRRVAARGRVPAVPTLQLKLAGPGTEGPCGSFVRERNISVDNAVRETVGFVIQKVTRVFTVEVFSAASGAWEVKQGAALDTYVNGGDNAFESQPYATCTTYWELWPVARDGRVVGRTDRFALCSIIPSAGGQANTSRGSFVITGEACLYLADSDDIDPLDPAGLAFTKNDPAVPAAGVLPARTSDPAAALAALGLEQSGPAVWFKVRVSWDSSKPDLGSEVEVFHDPAEG